MNAPNQNYAETREQQPLTVPSDHFHGSTLHTRCIAVESKLESLLVS